MNIIWKPSAKQEEAFDILNDDTTTELFYGGAAGGGKSYLGCCWIIINCIRYPGSRWLMGRAVLKSLKESTLLSFFMICKDWGLRKGEHYKYNSIESVIRFDNGSEVFLKDLYSYPSDPEFDSLGSTEFSGAFIDEASQVTEKAKNIVMSRIRYKLEEFKIIPKLFVSSNPSKNWLYYDFYKLWKEKTLPPYRKFVVALVQDNPFISHHYIENLKKLDKVSKERLLYGNFEYDDDPAKLFEYDDILDMFTNTPVEKEAIKCLSVDVARFGADKTVIFLWKGYHVERVHEYKKLSVEQVKKKILEIAAANNIPRSKIVIDEDGVGGGVVDGIVGCKGFVNNSRAIEQKKKYETPLHNYANLKSQCYFALADKVNQSKISIYKDISPQKKEALIEELEQVKRKDIDKDNKLQIVGKDKVKENLGRSPDFSDAMMMRMYFEVSKKDHAFFFG